MGCCNSFQSKCGGANVKQPFDSWILVVTFHASNKWDGHHQHKKRNDGEKMPQMLSPEITIRTISKMCCLLWSMKLLFCIQWLSGFCDAELWSKMEMEMKKRKQNRVQTPKSFVIFMSSAYKYHDQSALEYLNCRLYLPKIRKNPIITFFSVVCLIVARIICKCVFFSSSPSNKIFLFQIIYKVFWNINGPSIWVVSESLSSKANGTVCLSCWLY